MHDALTLNMVMIIRYNLDLYTVKWWITIELGISLHQNVAFHRAKVAYNWDLAKSQTSNLDGL